MAGVERKTINVTIPVVACEKCGADVVNRDWWYVLDTGSGTNTGVSAQLRRAGMKRSGKHRWDDLCEECAAQGKAVFTCDLCKQERSSDLVEESFGDPPEYLCTPCYETTTAKVWDERAEALRGAHRYDFE